MVNFLLVPLWTIYPISTILVTKWDWIRLNWNTSLSREKTEGPKDWKFRDRDNPIHNRQRERERCYPHVRWDSTFAVITANCIRCTPTSDEWMSYAKFLLAPLVRLLTSGSKRFASSSSLGPSNVITRRPQSVTQSFSKTQMSHLEASKAVSDHH